MKRRQVEQEEKDIRRLWGIILLVLSGWIGVYLVGRTLNWWW
jgi:hypothetical protein